MKTIATLMLAAAFLFARPAFAGDEAPKADKAEKKADKAEKKADKKDEKKEEKKADKGGW